MRYRLTITASPREAFLLLEALAVLTERSERYEVDVARVDDEPTSAGSRAFCQECGEEGEYMGPTYGWGHMATPAYRHLFAPGPILCPEPGRPEFARPRTAPKAPSGD